MLVYIGGTETSSRRSNGSSARYLSFQGYYTLFFFFLIYLSQKLFESIFFFSFLFIIYTHFVQMLICIPMICRDFYIIIQEGYGPDRYALVKRRAHRIAYKILLWRADSLQHWDVCGIMPYLHFFPLSFRLAVVVILYTYMVAEF